MFGDIHGDYKLTITLFTGAGLIQEIGTTPDTYEWIGGGTHVVQVGDQIDRCRPMDKPCSAKDATKEDENSDIKIIDFFNDMSTQAKKHGGDVISLIGNHEMLNVSGDMTYVSYEGLKGFEDKKFKSGLEGRQHMFRPGNEIGKKLGCTRYACVVIGSFLFVHGGIRDSMLDSLKIHNVDDIVRINREMSLWLLGVLDPDYVDYLIKQTAVEGSIFWSRILGNIPSNYSSTDPKCAGIFDNVMSILKIGSIVIGHTPQPFVNNAGINGTCDNKIIRVDTGTSNVFDKYDKHYNTSSSWQKTTTRLPQFLEIVDDTDLFICICKNNGKCNPADRIKISK